ncbi:MAG: hypothetical protein U9Q82_16350 [Chloroflexota bacterium]|nr:hypothetical protein [Chloroflexota bacterium]
MNSHLMDFSKAWKRTRPVNWQLPAACLLGGLALWPLVARLPVVGWDWFYWFYPRRIDFYPPWTEVVLGPLLALPWRTGLSLLNGIMLMTVAVGAASEDRSGTRHSILTAAGLAVVTPPVFMALWLGNVEGLVLLGIITFPPGVVLALMKPHLTGWAVLARRQWILWAVGFGVLSVLVWGWWPAQMVADFGRLTDNPMAIGWYNLGWPVAVLGGILLLFSTADPYRLMAAGFLLTPYLMPNHMLLLLPVLGRVSGWRRAVLWLFCWVSGVAAGIEEGALRYLVLSFPLAVWWFLRKDE